MTNIFMGLSFINQFVNGISEYLYNSEYTGSPERLKSFV